MTVHFGQFCLPGKSSHFQPIRDRKLEKFEADPTNTRLSYDENGGLYLTRNRDDNLVTHALDGARDLRPG
jgi:hypothetical protein